MSKLLQRITEKKISRRDFLSGVLGATGAAAGLSLTGCQDAQIQESRSVGVTEEAESAAREAAVSHAPITDPETGGEWRTAACWHNCGGRCLNKVYVADGMVIRQKTDDTHEDTPDYPQQRSCVRGHSQRMQCFGANRLKYPMKRKHWEPHTGGDKSLRGRDEWVRISWEEALDCVAEELRYAKETYGNASILLPFFGTSLYDVPKLLGMSALGGFGGYTEVRDSASFGSFEYQIQTFGLPYNSRNSSVDRMALRKSEYIILYGCNPAWASAGNPAYHFLQAKKAGADYVFVGPEYNVTAAMLEAKWIRVRPGSDTAFLLAVAYEMLMLEEEKGNVLDWDFLNRCAVGHDAEHMPEDAGTDENFFDYLKGKYDGVPKTAEWASEISGTPPEDIRWYAGVMGKEHKTAALHSFAPARCNNAEDFPQLFYTVGIMGGHWGLEGHACGECYHTNAGNNGYSLVTAYLNGLPILPNEPNMEAVKGPELWQAILDGKYNYTGNYQQGTGADAPSEIRNLDIHVIYHAHHAFLQSQMGLMKGIEAHRKVDFVLTQDYVMNTCAQYSDIVLPVTTFWERDNAMDLAIATNREAAFYPQKVTEPLYEARDDLWIVRELASRLGLNPDQLVPFDGKQAAYNTMAASMIFNKETMNMDKLVTITQEDIDEWGVSGEPQEGVIGLKELYEKGVYQVPRSEEDGLGFIAWQAFRHDPENNPLPSKSGKFEIYCQAKADIINAMKRSTVKPYPSYVRPLKGYEDSFSDWENKVKGEYPYQITNPHYLRTAHYTMDNVSWLRESWQRPLWMNPADAKEKGIQEGDTVLIYNEFGKTLRPAALTERLMPGVLALPHGAWADIDEDTGIDKAGADNVLCGGICAGVGVSGYNTTLVNFEKYSGPALEPDWMLPDRVVEF